MLELSGLHYFESREEANLALKQAIEKNLTDSISERGHASLWASGGETPTEFYKSLSTADIDWSKIVISLVDERCVPPTDEASNERIIRENLLINNAEASEFIPFFHVTPSVEENRERVEQSLRAKVKGALDVVILGMGNDGHVASLFPNAEGIENAVSAENANYTAALFPKIAPHPRISLTLNRLLASRNIYLLVFGEEKLKSLAKAEKEGDEDKMPIRYFLHNNEPKLQIYWAP